MEQDLTAHRGEEAAGYGDLSLWWDDPGAQVTPRSALGGDLDVDVAVVGADSDLVRLPWVDHCSPRWEPEPLRWLGVNAALLTTRAADRAERRRGTPSRLADLTGQLTGG